MEYIGEHLGPGKLGHFFILLSLIASLAATASYFLAASRGTTESKMYWKRLARGFFFAEVISVIAVFGLLIYLINGHYFEYKYVWQHSSRSLESKYLLSCLWEGQEGSFLLWSLWHCLLGAFFIWREKEWEAPVMTVVSFVQVLLATMVLGVTVFGQQIGSNPFILLRNSGLLDNAPAFFDAAGGIRADYLSLIRDGNDLNPLLQNYWMVIHPPVLFLGFASTLIPFGFALAGLWTKNFTGWTKRALPWALFSAGVLGLGIMMGAAWAYESLNFGGYWAWDPVENASLVPWLVLVAGVHTLLIYRHTGNALRTTYLFFILSFVFVLYSTYLTRSGDLQDTSVHAFTGEGITVTHLRIFLGIFLLPSLILFFRRYQKIPYIAKEEETSAREFWMFIGSLVLFLSALLISGMTSIPVFNKIVAFFTGEEKLFQPLAFGEDTAHAYNRIQIFVAIILGAFTGFGMYLKYKTTGKAFLKKLLWLVVAGLVLGGGILAFGDINYREHGIGYLIAIWVAVLASTYTVIANGAYIWTGLRGSMRRAGGAIAHLGFGLMLLGILLSSSKKEVISHNTSGIFMNFGKDSKENPGENLTLVQGVRNDMGAYWVTYERDSAHPEKPLWYYHIKFERKEGGESFTLTPNAFVNYKGEQGLMANPDAKHYLSHDIFTYITSLPDPSKTKDTANFVTEKLSVGDTLFYSRGMYVLEDLRSHKNIPGVNMTASDSATEAVIKVLAQTGSIYTIKPILINLKGQTFAQPDTVMAESLVLQLQGANGQSAELGVKESDALMKYVTLKAYKFPYINVLWLGTILMVIGFFISALRRAEVARARKTSPLRVGKAPLEAVKN